jgi:hypothetical protein
MNETSGALRPVIEAYLFGKPMSEPQILLMQAYLRQWIGASAYDEHAGAAERAWLAEMRARVDQLTSREAIDRWLDDAMEQNIDPL